MGLNAALQKRAVLWWFLVFEWIALAKYEVESDCQCDRKGCVTLFATISSFKKAVGLRLPEPTFGENIQDSTAWHCADGGISVRQRYWNYGIRI